MLKHARHILLCLRYGIGDVVMQTPALEWLRRAVPHARIAALGAEPAIELLQDDPRVDELVSVHRFGFSHWGDCGDGARKQSLREWLLRHAFDLILDLSHAVVGARDVLFQNGSTFMEAKEDAQNEALRQGADGVTAIKIATRSGWGIEIPHDARPALQIGHTAQQFGEEFVVNHGLHRSRIVGLSPVASSKLKQWPIERFAAVANRILEDEAVSVLIFAGPHMKECLELVGRIKDRSRAILIGRLHLQQVAALLAHCGMFLCNDTGLMHMSAACGSRVVAVFGPTCKHIYLPVYQESKGLEGPVPCRFRNTDRFGPSACILSGHCLIDERSCIDAVSVDRVSSACEATLQSVYGAREASRDEHSVPE